MGKPLLWDLVNSLYTGVTEHMPDFIKDRPMASAFVLGALGSYGLSKAVQVISNRFPVFDRRVMPYLEKVCRYVIVGGPLLYSIINPEGAKEVLMNHPVYTSGMTGVAAGGIVALTQDLHKREMTSSKGR